MEQWKVFYINGKEVGSYTIFGTFAGEEQATKELLASENGVNINDIIVKIETR
jgi:hypothetical protein